MNSLSELMTPEMKRLDAFALRTSGKTVAEIGESFSRKRATLYNQPDKLQRSAGKVFTNGDRERFEDFFGAEDDDFIRIIHPGQPDVAKPNGWALNPWKFAPILHDQGFTYPDIMRKVYHDDWLGCLHHYWRDGAAIDEYQGLMERNREIELSRFGRTA